VKATDDDRPRWLRPGSFALAGTVGVVVWFAARAFAGGSCPEHDALRVVSDCRVLVGSLAVRVGAVAAAAVLLFELVSAGLLRTAERMERDRRAAEREPSAGVGSG
jgi:hypothetical protein